jgi:hypothetical protein
MQVCRALFFYGQVMKIVQFPADKVFNLRRKVRVAAENCVNLCGASAAVVWKVLDSGFLNGLVVMLRNKPGTI